MEEVLFLVSILMMLVCIAIPVVLLGALIYFISQRQGEKKEEAKKDYSKY